MDPWGGFNQGMDRLGQTFTDLADSDRRRAAQALQDRLTLQQIESNQLKLEEAKREATVQQSAREAFQRELAAGGQRDTQFLPQKTATESLAFMPGQSALTTPTIPTVQPEASPAVKAYNEGRVKTTVTPPDPYGKMREAYLAGGLTGEAEKVTQAQTQSINLTDALMKRKAIAAANGDLETAYKLDAESTRLKVMGDMLEGLKKADPSGNMLKQVVKSKPELFPGVNPDKIGVSNGMVSIPFEQNGVKGVLMQTPDGKWMFEKAEKAPPPNEFNVFLENGLSQNKSKTQILQEWDELEKGRKKAGATNVNVNTGKADTAGVEAAVKNLPDLQAEAESANAAKGKITKMKSLLAAGAGGAKGYAAAKAAPWLESVGISTQGLSDAALFQTLAKTLGGSMRVQVVGPGPVSNYENELLQKISGGGVTSTEATQELLQYYSDEADKKIKKYNTKVDALAKVTPTTATLYPKIGVADTQLNPVKGNVVRYNASGERVK